MKGGFMSRKFKEGDVVWCTTKDYLVTCYHRPCRVMGYDERGYLLLQAFDQTNSLEHDVREERFELVQGYKILKEGLMIRIRGLDRPVKFKKYKKNSMIEVVDTDGWLSEYHVDSIIFGEGFYI